MPFKNNFPDPSIPMKRYACLVTSLGVYNQIEISPIFKCLNLKRIIQPHNSAAPNVSLMLRTAFGKNIPKMWPNLVISSRPDPAFSHCLSWGHPICSGVKSSQRNSFPTSVFTFNNYMLDMCTGMKLLVSMSCSEWQYCLAI